LWFASARRFDRPKRRRAAKKAKPHSAHETTSPLTRFVPEPDMGIVTVREGVVAIYDTSQLLEGLTRSDTESDRRHASLAASIRFRFHRKTPGCCTRGPGVRGTGACRGPRRRAVRRSRASDGRPARPRRIDRPGGIPLARPAHRRRGIEPRGPSAIRGDAARRGGRPGPTPNGWAIGSGPVEAACQAVIGFRLEGSGMRRGEDGSDALCRLRALFKSGDRRWDAFWRPTPN
jgi:hypothetical protein